MRLSEAVKIYEKESDTVENGLAAVLEAAGVELAPEPEPLPDFWGERLHMGKAHGFELCIYDSGGNGVLINPEIAGRKKAARNRAGLALSHSLRVAAAELVRRETSGDTYLMTGGISGLAIRRLRRILLANELPPEAGS